MIRISALISSTILALAGCGGTSTSFDELNIDANRIYDEVDETSATKYNVAVNQFRGGASYNGVAYGTLIDRRAEQSAYFNAAVDVDVAFDNGTGTVRGNMSNFVTENEEQLAGSLNFTGNIFERSTSTTTAASVETTMSGSIQSLGSSSLIPTESVIRGTAFGSGAQYMAGQYFDNGGDMGIVGSWVSER